MSIRIKQQSEKYVLVLDDEEWIFNDRKTMEAGLKYMLDMKDKHKKGVKNDRRNI